MAKIPGHDAKPSAEPRTTKGKPMHGKPQRGASPVNKKGGYGNCDRITDNKSNSGGKGGY